MNTTLFSDTDTEPERTLTEARIWLAALSQYDLNRFAATHEGGIYIRLIRDAARGAVDYATAHFPLKPEPPATDPTLAPPGRAA